MAERDYAREYREYHGKPEQIARRSSRNKARRLMIQRHGKSAVKGREVHHRDMNPRNNRPSNLAITSRTANRRQQPKRS